MFGGLFKFGSSGGLGDVTGAASSTDFELVLFSGGTGKVIKNSNLLADVSALTAPRTLTFRDLSGTVAFLNDIRGAVSNLTTTNNSLTTIATIPVLDNSVILLEVSYVAFRTDTSGDRAGYKREAVIYRESAGSATFQGNINTGLTRESTAQYNATMVVSGDNVLIQVAGQTGHTLNWKVFYEITVVS